MAVKIACPKCNAQYQLPESSLGKAVKCKSCGTVFKTKAPTNGALITQGQAAAKSQQQNGGLMVRKEAANTGLVTTAPAASEFARFGIEGPLRRPPEIFPSVMSIPRQQLPSVIEDPGFAIVSDDDEFDELSLESEEDDGDGMDAILNNPYMREKKKKKAKSEDQAVAPSGKKKKRKKKVHPAVKESLDQATMTMLIIGVLICGLFGFMLFNAEHDAKAMAANAGVEEMGFDEDEFAEEVASDFAVFYRFGMGLGGVFIGLAFLVQVFPITASITALAFTVLLDAWITIAIPRTLVSAVCWGLRIMIYGALGKAFMDALNARSFDKMMEERRKSKRK